MLYAFAFALQPSNFIHTNKTGTDQLSMEKSYQKDEWRMGNDPVQSSSQKLQHGIVTTSAVRRHQQPILSNQQSLKSTLQKQSTKSLTYDVLLDVFAPRCHCRGKINFTPPSCNANSEKKFPSKQAAMHYTFFVLIVEFSLLFFYILFLDE